MDYKSGKLRVVQLLERYISLKQGVRDNTKVGYLFVLILSKRCNRASGVLQLRCLKLEV